jgi:hypothetical protein
MFGRPFQGGFFYRYQSVSIFHLSPQELCELRTMSFIPAVKKNGAYLCTFKTQGPRDIVQVYPFTAD